MSRCWWATSEQRKPCWAAISCRASSRRPAIPCPGRTSRSSRPPRSTWCNVRALCMPARVIGLLRASHAATARPQHRAWRAGRPSPAALRCGQQGSSHRRLRTRRRRWRGCSRSWTRARLRRRRRSRRRRRWRRGCRRRARRQSKRARTEMLRSTSGRRPSGWRRAWRRPCRGCEARRRSWRARTRRASVLAC